MSGCECYHAREARKWRDLAESRARRDNNLHMSRSRELAENWRVNAHADYWLLYHLLINSGALASIGEPEVRAAYESMLRSGDHIRANELRPIMARSFGKEHEERK